MHMGSKAANKIGADNRAPRLQFHDFGFSIHLVAGSAALTGSVSDLARWVKSRIDDVPS